MEANSVGQVVETGIARASMQSTATATFPGIAHVALTVTDLDRSVEWYAALFAAGPDRVEDGESIRVAVWSLPGALVVLHEFLREMRTKCFEEFQPGLDHLAFRCGNRDELEAWATRLDALGVRHGHIVDAPYGSGLSFRDPDNIALEFFVAPR